MAPSTKSNKFEQTKISRNPLFHLANREFARGDRAQTESSLIARWFLADDTLSMGRESDAPIAAILLYGIDHERDKIRILVDPVGDTIGANVWRTQSFPAMSGPLRSADEPPKLRPASVALLRDVEQAMSRS